MNTKPVESSVLEAMGYDETREILQLEFRSHAVYRYFGVSSLVYESLVAASSRGSYFNEAIRGHFPHALISGTSSGQSGEE